MPTTAERHALLFLAAVALIGGGVRTVSANRFASQVGKAEHLSDGGTRSRTAPGTALGERALNAQIAAVDSARAARADRAKNPRPSRAAKTPVASSGTTRTAKRAESPPVIVDINRASAAELERLPRVGPALAQRIVAWREQHGPFRTLEDLRHVRGIGPATATLLAPSVTF